MTDEIDRSSEEDEFLLNVKVRHICSMVERIPVGTAGECDSCGEDYPRLVDGNCCRCRDKFKLY